MKPLSLILTVALFYANLLSAQVPVMEINDNGKFKSEGGVALQQLHADIKVYGTISTTTIRMVFYNGTDRLQEGWLTFPLPEGVSVSGFALDINGILREAVPIEKAKATAVFESIERRKVDPGLLEKTEGNNFRTRVYPLPANGARTIEITYNQHLTVNNGRPQYYLPFAKKKIKNFTLVTTVFDNIAMPSLVEKPDGSYVFEKKGNAWVAKINKTDFTPQRSLKIELPTVSDQPHAIVKRRTEGGYYFLSSLNIEAPASTPKKISGITIIWDNSLSGLKRNTEKEKEFLIKFFEANPDIPVKLCALSTKLSCVNEFKVTKGDAGQVLNAIDALVYDGATDYGVLNSLVSTNTPCLFFTDGLSNYGEASSLPQNAVHTIVSTPVADFNKLKYISDRTGGNFINLNYTEVGKAVTQLSRLPYRLLGFKYNPSLSEVHPTKSHIKNGNLIITGIAATLPTQVTLQFGNGNIVTKEINVTVNRKSETSDWGIEKFWAQQKIDEMELNYEENKNQIANLGKQFGIVTKNASLIVLEDVEDYVKYKITPPRELLANYNSIVKQRHEEQQESWNSLLDRSKQTMKDLKAWWNTDFSNVQKRRKISSRREYEQDAGAILIDSASASVEDPLSVAPPPPPSQEELKEVRIGSVNRDGESEVAAFESPATVDANSGSVTMQAASKLQEVVITKPVTKGKIITVDIKSDAAYMKEIENSSTTGEAYALYLKLRSIYETTPAFYFDVANWFFSKDQPERAAAILSNLAELELEDAELYKTMCYMLKRFGNHEKQLLLAKKILDWRPMDAQSFRDYALALQDNGMYQQALDTLYAALTQTYTEETLTRDEGIEEVLLMEINNLVSLHKNKLDISNIDDQLISDLPVDIRVALNWNMDNVDIDLHVTDPKGEECFYSNNRTHTGGRLSNDFTDGFGPEQYLLKRASRGKYKIETNFFGEQRVTASGPSTLMAEVFLSYASGKQESKIVVFQDTGATAHASDGKIYIGEFEF